MPRKYAKKPMKKRRPQRKRGIARQNFKNRVLAIVNKNREMKRLFFEIQENTIVPGGTGFLNFTYPGATGYTATTISNKVLRLQGDSTSFSRDGNEITPKYWEWKGIVKYQGASKRSGLEEVTVKMVLGYVDGDNAPLSETDNELQLSNGTNAPITTDYQGMIRRWNWKKFKPVAERVFKLAPAGYTQSTDNALSAVGENLTTGFNSDAPVSKVVSFKHYFGKNPRNIVYPNSGNVRANDRNLQLLIMSRHTNSDGNEISTSRNIEVSGEGHYAYMDC